MDLSHLDEAAGIRMRSLCPYPTRKIEVFPHLCEFECLSELFKIFLIFHFLN